MKFGFMKKWFLFLCMFGFLYGEDVSYGDFTTAKTVLGDLVVINGSVKISGGDLVVHGDLKVTGGEVFMDLYAGKLFVFGDLIVTNTNPGGRATLIAHDDIIVSGAIILNSLYDDAYITTTGSVEAQSGKISAERIITNAYGKAFVNSYDEIDVGSEINTRSQTDDAYVALQEDGPLYAGSILTDAYKKGYVAARQIQVIRELSTQSVVDSAIVNAGTTLYAGTLTTSSGADAYVTAVEDLEVKGELITTSTGGDAYVNVDSGSLHCGTIITNAYSDGYVSADQDVIAIGNIITNATVGAGYVKAAQDDIESFNITTSAMGDAYVDAGDDLHVGRDICTFSEAGKALVEAGDPIDAYSITTNGSLDSYVKSAYHMRIRGPIMTRSRVGDAYVRAEEGDIRAESIFTNGYGDAYVRVHEIEGIADLKVKDIVDTKSDAGDAYVYAPRHIEARSIRTNGSTSGYIRAVSGDITIDGDIRTKTNTGGVYVRASNGDILARSIKMEGDNSSDDSIRPKAGTGRFELFLHKGDNEITIKDCAFYLDRDYDFNTVLSIQGTCTLYGNGHHLKFGPNGRIDVNEEASLMVKNTKFDNVYDEVINCQGNSISTIYFNDVTWTQTSDSTIKRGNWYIFDDFVVRGPNTTFVYECNRPLTIHKNAKIVFDKKVTFSYDAPTENRIRFNDTSSKLNFDEAMLVAAEDVRFIKGTIVFDNAVTFSAEVNKTVYFGNNNMADNIALDFNLRSVFTTHGDVVDNNAAELID